MVAPTFGPNRARIVEKLSSRWDSDLVSLNSIGSVDTPSVALSDVYYIPNLTMNLASVSKIYDSRCDANIPTAHNSGLSPFEKLHGTLPDYSSLRVFSCTCFVLKPHVERTQLFPKSTLCVFLGYGISQKRYRCYDPVDQKLFTSRHVDFLEHIPYYSVLASSHNLTQSELIKIDPFEELTPIVSLITLEPASNTPLETTITTETPLVLVSEATPTVTQPPTTTQSSTKVVVGRPKRDYKSTKRDAFVSMAEELAALHQTQTWDLVPLLVGKRAIVSLWSIRLKPNLMGLSKGTRLVLLPKVMPKSMKIYQLDVNNAFLNGDLNEEVFMKPPPGVCHKLGEVFKLRKALYGLKHAPRAWYEKFATFVTSLGNDCVGIESLKLELAHRFAMKDLGILCYFMGIENYYKMVEDIPIDAKEKYTPTDVHIVSQFVCAPTTVHWAAVLPILRYLWGIQFQTLLFPSTPALDLCVSYDSDWAGDVVSSKSTTAFCIFLGDLLISWKSKKQDVLSKSSNEFEYHSMAVTTSKIVWLCWLLANTGVRISHSTLLHCDNRSAIQIARKSVFHEHTKHFEIDCHFTRHRLQAGTISLSFVSSTLQIIDFLHEEDVVNLLNYVPGYREIEVYIENGVSSVESLMMESRFSQGKGLVIEEILEENVIENLLEKRRGNVVVGME
ncbi:retrovirus-related pol polyprotein from transposon TNT 1-94 [Tanacetum coccineum]